MKKILFISHDASRTGAPIVFLNFLRWFKENTNIPFQILLRNGGELEAEFAALSSTLVYEQYRGNSLIQRATKRLGFNNPNSQIKHKLANADIGLIYSNTATNGYLLQDLSDLNCPVISHIHELEYWIYQSKTGWDKTKNHSSHYIAASQAVKNNLVEKHNISSEQINVVHEFVNTLNISSILSDQIEVSNKIRKQLQIPPDAFVVGGSGTTDWRKGADIFLYVTKYIHKHPLERPVHFVWVGGAKPGDVRYFELQYEIEKLGIKPYVHLTGAVPNPLDYFTIFDVFALTSREDPYPLVCLEAAALAKPVLCFDGAGGEKEFVEEDCGFVVPYLDIETMGDKILMLLKSPDLRRKIGIRANEKVVERHDISVAAPQIVQIIKNHFN